MFPSSFLIYEPLGYLRGAFNARKKNKDLKMGIEKYIFRKVVFKNVRCVKKDARFLAFKQ